MANGNGQMNRILPKYVYIIIVHQYILKSFSSHYHPFPCPASTVVGALVYTILTKNHVQLFDENRKLLLLYEKNQHFFQASTPPTIQISYKALDHLDMVILGLVVEMEDIDRRKKRRRRRR